MVFPPMPPGPPGTPGGQQMQEAFQRQAQAAMLQREREEAERRARKAAFDAAAAKMRETGAVCDVSYADASGAGQACRVAAAGRCSVCSRAFCLSHRSSDLSEISGLTSRMTFFAATDLCAECQQKQIKKAVLDAESHAREAKAEQELAAKAAEAARLQKERQDRVHAERVAAHELQTQWAAAQRHIDELQARIRRIPERGSVRPVITWLSSPVILFAILLALISVAPSNGLSDASPIGFVYFIIALVLCYGFWLLMRLARRSIRARHVKELRTLTKSRDRGCGEADCQRCYPVTEIELRGRYQA